MTTGGVAVARGTVSLVPQLKAKQGWTNEQLATAMGVHRHTAGRIAKGERLPETPEEWDKLCRFLGVAPDDILVYLGGLEEGSR
jgi:DNA-binding Xre family transcriptional regulator